MKYYIYNPDANYFSGVMFGTNVWDEVEPIRSVMRPVLPHWSPPRCVEFGDNPPTAGDFPSLANNCCILVMSDRAWRILRPLIGYCCEALPIIHHSGDAYYINHVMNAIDCLDESRSVLERSQIVDRVAQVYKYAFKEELLRREHIFRLPVESGGEQFVDDEFRKVVEKNHLKGLLFDPLPMVESGSKSN